MNKLRRFGRILREEIITRQSRVWMIYSKIRTRKECRPKKKLMKIIKEDLRPCRVGEDIVRDRKGEDTSS